MLTPIKNVTLEYVPNIEEEIVPKMLGPMHLYSVKEKRTSDHGHVKITVGKRAYIVFNDPPITKNEFAARTGIILLKDSAIFFRSQAPPLKFILDGVTCWLYNAKLYKDEDDLKSDDVKALIDAREQKKAQKIKHAKTLAAITEVPETARRGFISEEVRLLIWKRDEGKCTKCGSTTELQYDHIIPFSLGGASTSENLQILCGRCNRAKSASVA